MLDSQGVLNVPVSKAATEVDTAPTEKSANEFEIVRDKRATELWAMSLVVAIVIYMSGIRIRSVLVIVAQPDGSSIILCSVVAHPVPASYKAHALRRIIVLY